MSNYNNDYWDNDKLKPSAKKGKLADFFKDLTALVERFEVDIADPWAEEDHESDEYATAHECLNALVNVTTPFEVAMWGRKSTDHYPTGMFICTQCGHEASAVNGNPYHHICGVCIEQKRRERMEFLGEDDE